MWQLIPQWLIFGVSNCQVWKEHDVSVLNNPLQIWFETHNPYCPEWGQKRWRFSFLTILSSLTIPSTGSLSWPFSQWVSSTASHPTSPGTTPCTPAQQHTEIWHPGMTECSQQCDPIPELGENNNNRKPLFAGQTTPPASAKIHSPSISSSAWGAGQNAQKSIWG